MTKFKNELRLSLHQATKDLIDSQPKRYKSSRHNCIAIKGSCNIKQLRVSIEEPFMAQYNPAYIVSIKFREEPGDNIPIPTTAVSKHSFVAPNVASWSASNFTSGYTKGLTRKVTFPSLPEAMDYVKLVLLQDLI